ncbi:ABC transporter substrate-binding protein [Candidatus Entotheonella palauensis]|uniref:ABC transporter substrate-binding protein n=1 Tax=Candidatus Entotheonella palauensis TaxID=93172 RepID=UPI000B7D1676|nr:ABC transporter substrate-binding protein [Candidatus Entotheonella palauensis]
MDKIDIQFTLFSAFYSPLIVTMAGGFLKEEGLEASWSVAPPGVSAIKALEAGEAQVIQSAPSQGFTSLGNGETPIAVHFAQINEMDGFFLTAREPEPNFSWNKLEGAEVVLFGGGQPLAMFKYACHKAGIDFDKLKVINVGGADGMDQAFREGQGTYVQQQGPYPQQLVKDGVGHIVAQVGKMFLSTSVP